jgi:hypothetical protein
MMRDRHDLNAMGKMVAQDMKRDLRNGPRKVMRHKGSCLRQCGFPQAGRKFYSLKSARSCECEGFDGY